MVNIESVENTRENEYQKTRTYQRGNTIFVEMFSENKEGEQDLNLIAMNRTRTIVDAMIENQLKRKMEFLFCNISLGIINENMTDIEPLSNLEFSVRKDYHYSKLVSGNCYCKVIFESEIVIVDVIFYKNVYTGHEFYGLTSSDLFLVFIKILRPGHVIYFLYEE
jgi:hypothetical protein